MYIMRSNRILTQYSKNTVLTVSNDVKITFSKYDDKKRALKYVFQIIMTALFVTNCHLKFIFIET